MCFPEKQIIICAWLKRNYPCRSCFKNVYHYKYGSRFYVYCRMEELLSRYYAYQKKIQLAATIRNVVANDQNNRMPFAAHMTRADQLSYINGHIYELSNDPEYVALVRELLTHADTLSPKDRRSLSLAGVAEDTKHSKAFREEFDTLKSHSLATRHKAKEANDRSLLSPALEKTFEKAKDYARLYNPDMQAFSVWCDYSEFTMRAETYEALFYPLRNVSREILASTKKKPKNKEYFVLDYDEQQLLALLHELLGTIGFDFKQGVLSSIKRPYSENCGPYDERIHIGK